MNSKNIVLSCIILLISLNLFSQNTNRDTSKNANHVTEKLKPSGIDAGSEKDVGIYIHVSTGLYLNSTLGAHPIFNAQLGIANDKNVYCLDYEQRFGPAKHEYRVLDNDTLKQTNIYNGECFSFTYEHTLYDSERQKLVLHSGLGYDWFTIPKGDVIHNSKTIGGLDVNIGIAYSFYFITRHGPSLMLIYHYSNLKNAGGSAINPSSLVCRLTYNFGHDSFKGHP